MNLVDFLFLFDKIIKIKIEATNATTPPNFDGIERKITYANKKYHSGWMWTGVTNGLAWLKFSTSPNKFGALKINVNIIIEIKIVGVMSLIENEGWNFILSVFVFILFGFEDPFSCSSIKWINIITMITNGKMKCKEKNRFKVGCETEGPPQIHTTKSFPIIGMAEITPVITVAPQKDICPHGSTYPKNAVAIVINIIITPDIHTSIWLEGEEK